MQQRPNLIGPIIISIAIVLGAIAFALLTILLKGADTDELASIAQLETILASQQRDIEVLSGQIQALSDTQKKLLRLQETAPLRQQPPASQVVATAPAESSETQDLIGTVDIRPKGFNKGLIQPKNSFMIRTLGHPRDIYGENCLPVTNPRLIDAMTQEKIGSFRVTMLKPAMESFKRVMERLKESDIDIYNKVGTAGALCARLIRGSKSSVSNHSWGTAIDIKLDDQLDRFADGETQFGLLIIAEYFNDEGWYWGASYGREDSMHFEASEALIQSWVDAGEL